MNDTSTTNQDISVFLEKQFCAEAVSAEQTITIAEIMARMHERGFGLIIILLCLPISIPGCPPPIPSIFALPLCVLCYQMLLRRDTPSLPNFIEKKAINHHSLQKMMRKTLPYVKRIEAYIKPRYQTLTTEKAEQKLGVCMLLFSITILIPLPMTNTIPGIAMIIMSVGLISKDGLMVLLGTLLGIAWITFLCSLTSVAIEYITQLLVSSTESHWLQQASLYSALYA